MDAPRHRSVLFTEANCSRNSKTATDTSPRWGPRSPRRAGAGDVRGWRNVTPDRFLHAARRDLPGAVARPRLRAIFLRPEPPPRPPGPPHAAFSARGPARCVVFPPPRAPSALTRLTPVRVSVASAQQKLPVGVPGPSLPAASARTWVRFHVEFHVSVSVSTKQSRGPDRNGKEKAGLAKPRGVSGPRKAGGWTGRDRGRGTPRLGAWGAAGSDSEADPGAGRWGDWRCGQKGARTQTRRHQKPPFIQRPIITPAHSAETRVTAPGPGRPTPQDGDVSRGEKGPAVRDRARARAAQRGAAGPPGHCRAGPSERTPLGSPPLTAASARGTSEVTRTLALGHSTA